jgi:hypothetical protein
MMNELRALADKANENKKKERAEAVKHYVEKHIVPQLKKRAEAGYYSFPIENYGGFKPGEIYAYVSSLGLDVTPTSGGYRVMW